jgi:hypothetical protein
MVAYIHFTDLEGARAINASGELWASSFVSGVFAVPVGGHSSPGVQLTKLGRPKSRGVAVVFETDVLPDYCYPEECVWETDKIPIVIRRIMLAVHAMKLLDGSIPTNGKDNFEERLLIPTKEDDLTQHQLEEVISVALRQILNS